jgi:hypothetical protein
MDGCQLDLWNASAADHAMKDQPGADWRQLCRVADEEQLLRRAE